MYCQMFSFFTQVFLKTICIKIIKLLIYYDNIKNINFLRKRCTESFCFGFVACPLWKFIFKFFLQEIPKWLNPEEKRFKSCFDQYGVNGARQDTKTVGQEFLTTSLIANSRSNEHKQQCANRNVKPHPSVHFKRKKQAFSKPQGHWDQTRMGILSLYLIVTAVHTQLQTSHSNAAVWRPLLQHSSYACSLTANKKDEVKC
jgi:hypothetical protein